MTPTEVVYRLLSAAGRVCDLYDDGEQARVDMRADVLATPAHLHADLLDHLTSVAPAITHSDGASIDPFTGPPGDPSSTGNSDPDLGLFTTVLRGVKLSPDSDRVFQGDAI